MTFEEYLNRSITYDVPSFSVELKPDEYIIWDNLPIYFKGNKIKNSAI